MQTKKVDTRQGVWTITVELPLGETHIPSPGTDQILEELSEFGAALTTSDLGRVAIIMSVQAQTLAQAMSTARALLIQYQPIGLTIETAADFDRRRELARIGLIPPLLSTSEAAAALQISRTAVIKRCTNGSLPAVKVGEAGWVIPAAAIPNPDNQVKDMR
ncbi:helix-turn-helix domain-containing protein [Propionicimonas sp.]|uniref:helix-turn-helix domain-containing protein n=1 Tax=Propionicimonas sp. TaxID=1955623 RepID=UPI00181D98B3|nr:helix-turn-helix domain-containing protein [Propionicimonas sp.]MBA3019671.1 helix-turn-helix domain-containing protein [Propionicimonas sp.]MBU4207984.1 helix-turn-helix domain-containing protein [Actinomycetota bacterium]MBU4411478.1 helix-turn-helix domain-containing protein [Actinomycetota bacterium]MCG2805790.1 helix-turn-helix domain-containing protein [Propionicimonas sp.]